MMGAREDRQGKGATVGHCGRGGTRHKVLEASVLSTGFPLMCNCDGEEEDIDVDYTTYSDDTFQENMESWNVQAIIAKVLWKKNKKVWSSARLTHSLCSVGAVVFDDADDNDFLIGDDDDDDFVDDDDEE